MTADVSRPRARGGPKRGTFAASQNLPSSRFSRHPDRSGRTSSRKRTFVNGPLRCSPLTRNPFRMLGEGSQSAHCFRPVAHPPAVISSRRSRAEKSLVRVSGPWFPIVRLTNQRRLPAGKRFLHSGRNDGTEEGRGGEDEGSPRRRGPFGMTEGTIRRKVLPCGKNPPPQPSPVRGGGRRRRSRS